MKKFILSIILFSSYANANSINNFIGKYKLVEKIKETKGNIKTRGSLCREKLNIYLSKDNERLFIVGNSENPFGLTMNWIALEENENHKTEISDDVIFQSRFGINDYLRLNLKYSYDTRLLLENSHLKITYQEFDQSLLTRKMKIINESSCVYVKE